MPKPSDVRKAIAERIPVLDPKWTESRLASDIGINPQDLAHQRFAVDIPTDTAGGRQGRNITVTSTILVRFGWRVTAPPQLVAQDAGLDAEADLIRHLMTWRPSVPFSLVYTGANRRSVTEGFRVHELGFNAVYYLEF